MDPRFVAPIRRRLGDLVLDDDLRFLRRFGAAATVRRTAFFAALRDLERDPDLRFLLFLAIVNVG